MPDLKPIPDNLVPNPYSPSLRVSDLTKVKEATNRQLTGGDGVNVDKFGNRLAISQQDIPTRSTTLLATFVVAIEMNDYLLCMPYTFTPNQPQPHPPFDDPTVNPLGTVWVCKPRLLQQKPFSGPTNGGMDAPPNPPKVNIPGVGNVTYQFTSVNQRTASGMDANNNPITETQVIVPAYFPGDIIVARQGPTGYPIPDWQMRLDSDVSTNQSGTTQGVQTTAPMIGWIDINEGGRAWSAVSS